MSFSEMEYINDAVGNNCVYGDISSGTITIDGKVKRILIACGNGSSNGTYVVAKYDSDISTTQFQRLAYTNGGGVNQDLNQNYNIGAASIGITSFSYSNGVTTIGVGAGTVNRGYFVAELE